MRDIFISYVEEDGGVVRTLAEGIEAEGYSVWFYERDGVPGASYLLQTRTAIDQCQAFLLLISPSSVISEQVTLEIVRAHEINKAFIPLRFNITHLEFAERQPEWAQALGAATSTLIPPEGPATTIPQVLRGLKKLNILPRPATASGTLPTGPLSKFERNNQDPVSPPRKTIEPILKPKAPERKTLYLIAAAAVLVVACVVAFFTFKWGAAGKTDDNSAPLTTEAFRDQFDDLAAWTKPSAWSVDKSWLLINGSPELGYVTDKRYRNFVANFRIRIDGNGGAAWALRVNQDGYYLCVLTGPTDTQAGQFSIYIYREAEDKLQKVGTTHNLIRPLVTGGEYTVTITAQNNIFIHELKIESAGEGEWDGEVQKFSEYQDNDDTFREGSLGFRAYTSERFAIGHLMICPPPCDPLQ